MSSSVQTDSADEVGDALQALHNAATTPARQRTTKISAVVDIICDHAFNNGLDTPHLHLILDLITRKTELDQTSVTNLIKNLYPAQRVENEDVILVVGCLGQAKSKPTSATQALLVKWLIAVYEFLEDATIISKLYNVLFSLLDMISLRSHLCHLLALATKRKHVRPFRMQQLLELISSVGNEPALLGLTAVYKDYYPDVILSHTNPGRAKAFVHPNLEWRERLRSIQQANLRDHNGDATIQNGFKIMQHHAKRIRFGDIPQVHTLHAQEVKSSVTLEEISSVGNFVENLERIELPSQLIASLHDPLLQKYLSLMPSELSSQRIRNWLLNHESEDDGLQVDVSHAHRQEDVLAGILSFASVAQTLPPGAEGFTKRLLTKWDGSSASKPLLDCLVLLPQRDFQGQAEPVSHLQDHSYRDLDFLESIIKPVEKHILVGNPNPFPRILQFYTDLARHLLIPILATNSKADDYIIGHLKHFEQLAHHVMDFLLPVLTTPPVSESTMTTVTEFLEILVAPLRHFNLKTSSIYGQLPIILPQPHTIYLLLFDSSLSNLSRLCANLAVYKDALEKRRLSASPPSQQIVGRFNGYLMDVCNLLWRSRAFRKDDSHAAGCLISEPVSLSLQEHLEAKDREYGLSYIFGFSHHPTISPLSIAALRELEDLAETQGQDLRVRHAGPVTQRSLMKLDKDGGVQLSWKDYRVHVLQYMERHCLEGVKELMFSTMKDLFPKTV
ncbi:MAG: Phosphate metabolism transcription protein [Bathelium mastoideum]|nr:MAG: Phosphate metabolism transcription protein [Bathelium mastoideum]